MDEHMNYRDLKERILEETTVLPFNLLSRSFIPRVSILLDARLSLDTVYDEYVINRVNLNGNYTVFSCNAEARKCAPSSSILLFLRLMISSA